jgi:hypothetical protein
MANAGALDTALSLVVSRCGGSQLGRGHSSPATGGRGFVVSAPDSHTWCDNVAQCTAWHTSPFCAGGHLIFRWESRSSAEIVHFAAGATLRAGATIGVEWRLRSLLARFLSAATKLSRRRNTQRDGRFPMFTAVDSHVPKMGGDQRAFGPRWPPRGVAV